VTALAATPTAPCAVDASGLPLWRRAVRALLVVGGVVFGLWLLGLLLGSASAHAAPQPTTPDAVSVLATTTQTATGDATALVQTVSTNVGSTVAKVPATVAPLAHSTQQLVQRTTQNIATATRTATAPVVTKLVPSSAARPTTSVHRPATVPSMHSSASASVRAQTMRATMRSDVVRDVMVTPTSSPSFYGSHLVSSESSALAPAPATPARPQLPAVPSPVTPSTGVDAHELGLAILPAAFAPVHFPAASAAADDALVEVAAVGDPSFSPD
jgi:hypothetical protein